MANSKNTSMVQRQKLMQLIEIVSEISKKDGNEWFVDELLKSIGDTASLDYLSKNAVIRNIHEYCIEKVIEDQAREFYKDFPVLEIKEQLIQDFINMEHERRNGNFENFSLSLYQQVELVVNHIWAKKIEPNWSKIKDSGYDNYNSLYDFMFYSSTNLDFDINKKFKSIIYIYHINNNDNNYKYKPIIDMFVFVKEVRNLNHRGGGKHKKQEDRLKEIEKNKSSYYLKFYGFLGDIFSRFETTMKNLDTPISKLAGGYKNSSLNESLADSNPQLRDLLNQNRL